MRYTVLFATLAVLGHAFASSAQVPASRPAAIPPAPEGRSIWNDVDAYTPPSQQAPATPEAASDPAARMQRLAGATQPSLSLTPDQLFKKVSPAVAKIIVKNDNDKPIASGSGFFVSVDHGMGALVTNYHVIRSAVNAVVQLNDDSEAPVISVLAEDEAADLAVLTVECKPDRVVVMQSNMWDEVDQLTNGVPGPEIGTRIFCVSSPKGLKNTLSEGLVSGYRRDKAKAVWIQTSAPISPGSSGGPILRADGTVIGVATSYVVDGQNLNFAIPMSCVKQLMAGPRSIRPVWKGTSVRLEESSAESEVFSALLGPDNIPATQNASEIEAPFRKRLQKLDQVQAEVEADFPKFVEKLASGGSQDGLLYKGIVQAQSKDYRGAIETLKRAAKVKPGPHEYLVPYELGKALFDLGRADAAAGRLNESSRSMTMAASSLSRSKEENPDFSPTFRLLALLYMQTNHGAEAVDAANRLVQLAPESAESYRVRGAVYQVLHRDDDAATDLKTAAELDPLNFKVCFSLAGLSIRRKCPLDAIHAATGAVEAAGSPYERFLALDSLGIAYSVYGDYRRAIDAFEESLKFCQDPARAHQIQELIMRYRQLVEH